MNAKSADITDKIFYRNNINNSKRTWQFKRLQKLSAEFLKNHQKCPYSALYNYYTKDNDQLTNYQVFAFLFASIKRTLPKIIKENKSFMKQLQKSTITYNNNN